ncbi:MAG: hypothetical protein WCH75_24720 [Candidatus Binatia bacterium]
MRRIIVNIDSLVLKGFRYEDRHTIAAAVQEELTRTLSAPESARQIAALGSIPQMQIGNVPVKANAKPQQVGAASGRAIGQGLIK